MTGYEIVAHRSFGICEKCGAANAEQMHHRQARGMGGSKIRNGAENLLHLCAPCHHWIEANPADSYEHGWKVRRGMVAGEMPVTYRNDTGVILTPGGHIERDPS